MMFLGCPVVNQKEYTVEMIKSLVLTIDHPENFTLVVVDNNSDPSYRLSDLPKTPFETVILHNKENKGYYYPLKQLAKMVVDPQTDLVGLVHNDIIFYEQRWNVKLADAFESTPRVGLVGMVGSYEVDYNGGRGGGTMCYFRGERGQSQSAGLRISGLRPAMILDSLFMMFRATVVPYMKIDDEITPCHFYDRIWSLRTVESGWNVGVFGTEIDHLGGVTSVAESKYRQDAMEWCQKHGLAYQENQGDHAIYLEGERRYLSEYRDQKHLLPSVVDNDWTIRKLF